MTKIKFVQQLVANSTALIFSGMILVGAQAALAQTSASAYTVFKSYDLNGQITGVITPDPDGSGPRTFAAVRNTYNLQGLLDVTETGTFASLPLATLKPADWVGFSVTSVKRFTYDNWGRKLTVSTKGTGGSFALTQNTYDGFGRLDCEAVRMNPDVYNSLPPSACTLSAVGGYGQDRITKYNYDVKNRVISIVKAYGTGSQQTYATYTYNNFWEKENITDANGNLAKMVYDGFGRLKQWQFPSKAQVGTVNTADYEEYGYDLNDNRVTLRKRDAQVIGYTFDNLNRVITKDLPGTANDVTYVYDNRGLELSSTFSTSLKGIITAYDGFGRITSSTNSLFTVSKTLSYEYDDNGNRTKVTHPDGVKFGYAYDGLNLLTNVCENADSVAATVTAPLALRCADTTKEVISPDYDSTANRSSLVVAGGGVTSYRYDSNNRLESFTHNLNGTTYDIATSFTYNPASQVTTRAINNELFTYKGNQNITGAYIVNGLNQYDGAGGKTFAYDNNSNLTSDGVTTFSYDTENRLTNASGAKNATLKYDPKGRLFEVGTTNNGVTSTTQFLYDGDALVAEYNNGTLINRYVHGSRVDEPYLWYVGSGVSSSNRRNLYTDYQGSVVAVTNSGAAVQGINTYDAYGIPGANNLGRFSYTGQIYLPEVGLYHYKARMYSPALGRFMQTDPIGYTDQMNLYTYVGNDFANKIDPSGLAGCDKYSWCTYIDYTVSRSSSNSPSYTPGNGMNQALVTSEQALENVEMGVAAASLVIAPELVVARAATGASRLISTAEKAVEVNRVVRTTRSGEKAVRITNKNGAVKDISKARVKEYTPNTHPNAPQGALDRVKFSNSLPGSKGFKRAPTSEELDILEALE